MKDLRNDIGRRGEEIAAAFLQQKGFRILERNWRCRMGEIDLIVERGGEIRFIEVKFRQTTTYGYPEESITPTKLRHLAASLELWLRTRPQMPKHYQADAIAILLEPGNPADIRWIEAIL